MSNATLKVTTDQIAELLEQLPDSELDELLLRIVRNRARQKARQAASARGLNLDTMKDEEVTAFVNDLIHEARSGQGR